MATTAADKKRAEALERERKAREAAQKPSTASGFNSRPAAVSEVSKSQDKSKRQKKRVKKAAGTTPQKASPQVVKTPRKKKL